MNRGSFCMRKAVENVEMEKEQLLPEKPSAMLTCCSALYC